MDYTLTVNDARLIAGIEKQLVAYNSGQAPGQALSAEQYLAANLPLQAWADRWAPALVPTGAWLQRWSAEEKKATRQLGATDAQVQAWLDELDANAEVNLTHDVVRQGVAYVCAVLEAQGVIATGQASVRASAILAF